MIEALRHDADNRVRPSIQHQRLAEYVSTGAEMRLPKGVRQDSLTVHSGLIFSERKGAAQQRLNTEEFEQVAAGTCRLHMFRLSTAAQRQISLHARSELRKGVALA